MKKIFSITLLILSLTFLIFLVITLTVTTNPPCVGMGCTGNYHFSDTALFIAPKSAMASQVTTKGFVPEGADIGDGKSMVKLYKTNSLSDTLYLTTTPTGIESYELKGIASSRGKKMLNKETFYNFISASGFSNIETNEMEELYDAITLINYGHKAGNCKGQTKFIEVADYSMHNQEE